MEQKQAATGPRGQRPEGLPHQSQPHISLPGQTESALEALYCPISELLSLENLVVLSPGEDGLEIVNIEQSHGRN